MTFGLDTTAFLNGFYRMVNRRGVPMEVVTDTGGCFVAANKELKELVSDLDEKKIKEATSLQKIKWHFNPPFAPHFGGVFEIMIKSAKWAVYDQFKNADINDEELLSAFAEAEGLINSRPLTYQSADVCMYHQLPQIISCLVSLAVSLLQKWKSRSTMVLREDGGMFNSWFNTFRNQCCK